MNEQHFLDVIEQNPELCADGLGIGDRTPAEFETLREQLKKKHKDFEYACKWLKLCKPAQKPSKFATSLELKHYASRYFDFADIRHGAFIAAALYLGIPHVEVPGKCSVYLAIAQKLPAQL